MNDAALAPDTKSKHSESVAKQLRFSTLPSLNQQIIFRLPVIHFIKELSSAIREASDQALRPQPNVGFNTAYKKEIELAPLLQCLETGEKKLGLIADSTPGFNSLSNISRSIALICSGIVRNLRKELICGKADPAHPEQKDISTLVSLLDNSFFQLQTERIKMEDLVLNIVLREQVNDYHEDAA